MPPLLPSRRDHKTQASNVDQINECLLLRKAAGRRVALCKSRKQRTVHRFKILNMWLEVGVLVAGDAEEYAVKMMSARLNELATVHYSFQISVTLPGRRASALASLRASKTTHVILHLLLRPQPQRSPPLPLSPPPPDFALVLVVKCPEYPLRQLLCILKSLAVRPGRAAGTRLQMHIYSLRMHQMLHNTACHSARSAGVYCCVSSTMQPILGHDPMQHTRPAVSHQSPLYPDLSQSPHHHPP